MTTNWREKLEALWNKHIPRGEIGAPFLRDAESLIREARRAAFEEGARSAAMRAACFEWQADFERKRFINEGSAQAHELSNLFGQIAKHLSDLAAKEGET